MAEQITWTHVDKLVRKMHEERGMLPTGLTDAEITYSFIKWQERQRSILLLRLEQQDCEAVQLRNQVRALAPKSKTKQRLAILEAAVEDLQAKLERNCL
jgi:hypothetical protein